MAIYSHSQLSTYETCPLQYKFNYIDKIRREEQGIEAFMGNCFHETMALLYKDLNFSIHAVDELLSYYDERWDKEYSDKVIIVKKNKTVDDYRSIGKKCIQDYYKSYHPFDQAKVLGIERQVNFDLDGEGQYKLKGYIDRIDLTGDGTYEIHDYKTSGFLPEQSQADKDRQLALYEIGLRKMWNDADRVRLVWHYVVFDKELSSARTDEDLNKLKSDTISLINEIEKVKEFKPKESYLCGWCSYKRFCPKKKHLVKVAGLSPNEYKEEAGVYLVEKYTELETEKEKHAAEILVIEKEQAKIKEAAIDYAEKEQVSVIDGPGGRLKVETKQELKAPTRKDDLKKWQDLRDFMIQEGKYNDVSTINANMLRNKINTHFWPKEFIGMLKIYLTEATGKIVKFVRK